jgi:hypothetical protein
MGMKKERDEDERRCKKSLPCLIVVLFVLGTLIAPAMAQKEDKLTKLEEKLLKVEEDQIINSHLYNLMLEYDNCPNPDTSEGKKAVKIVVTEGKGWGGTEEVMTFYVVRNDDCTCINITDTYDGGEDPLWTFKPTIGDTNRALDVLLSHRLTVGDMMHCGISAIKMPKDNVTESIPEIIDKSCWANERFPEWIQELLERFDERWLGKIFSSWFA